MPKREYVIACNEHSRYSRSLLFWGSYTNDEERRSFSGYTDDLDKCEKYTLEEIEASGYDFAVYSSNMTFRDFQKYDDIAIKVEQLAELGCTFRKCVLFP